MKFEININPEDIPAVMKEVNEMHNVALHNLGNAMVRTGISDRELKIANATKIVRDLLTVVTESIIAKENGEDPKNYSFGDVCCEYIE